MKISGNVSSLSLSGEPFRDHIEAGEILAEEIKKENPVDPVVVSPSNGGLMVAQEVARNLDADLDILLIQKIVAPHQTEMIVGAVDESDMIFLHENLARRLGVSDHYILHEKDKHLKELAHRKLFFRHAHERVNLAGRDVIVIDEGMTVAGPMQAALWSVIDQEPRRIIMALPVASQGALEQVANMVSKVICLRTPPFIRSLNHYFLDHAPVSDEEAAAVLKDAALRKTG